MPIGNNVTIRSYKGRTPKISPEAYIFENVSIYGDVTIEAGCVVMPGCVIRSEQFPIVIGKGSNLQDLTILHDETDLGGVNIGENVTVGHGVILHACTIKANAIIGMGSIVQNEAVVGSNCLIGAGAVVTERTVIKDGMMALGIPAKERRPLTEKEVASIEETALEYQGLAKEYLAK